MTLRESIVTPGDLGAGFTIEGEKVYTGGRRRFDDTDHLAFADELHRASSIRISGVYDDAQFRAGLIRDFGNVSRPELDDLKTYVSASPTEGDAAEVFTAYERPAIKELCVAKEGGNPFTVPGASESAGCDVDLKGVQYVVAIARTGRFITFVTASGDLNNANRQIVMTAAEKTVRKLAKAK